MLQSCFKTSFYQINVGSNGGPIGAEGFSLQACELFDSECGEVELLIERVA